MSASLIQNMQESVNTDSVSAHVKFTFLKMWYIYTIEYYSAIKKNEIMSFAATWMDLEIIILSEVRQRETNTTQYHCMWNLKYDTNELICKTETDSQT